MKVLFDTSVLVAAMATKHPDHDVALPWLVRASQGEISSYMSCHTLAETYSVLTRHPDWNIPPAKCQQSLLALQGYLKVIALDADDYNLVVSQLVQLNLTGGSIYDALHAQAARKENVDMLLTFNSKHFVRLGQDIAERVHVPS